MATPTYDLLDSTTLASSASSVTFSSISQDYRDLVLVVGWGYADFRFNSDTGSNYSKVVMAGRSAGASSASGTGTVIGPQYASSVAGVSILQIMDYSATDKHKSCLLRISSNASVTEATAGRWANTAALTAIEVRGTTFPADTTFHLFGIAS